MALGWKTLLGNVLVLVIFSIVLTGCASKASYVHRHLSPEDVLPQGNVLSDEYGYLYMAHDKVLGNPTLSHLVMDNCRYAGTFYSDTFLLVKLVPGKHFIRLYRPAKSFYDKSIQGNFASLDLNISGGEILVYDNHIGWSTGMELEQKGIDMLDGLPVSKGCVDCEKDPDPEQSLDLDCFQ